MAICLEKGVAGCGSCKLSVCIENKPGFPRNPNLDLVVVEPFEHPTGPYRPKPVAVENVVYQNQS